MSDTGAPIIDFGKYFDAVDEVETIHVRGRVTEVTGLVIKATVPGVRIGEMCYIDGAHGDRITCEVVGFKDEQVMLMPLGEAIGIGPDCEVLPSGKPFRVSTDLPDRHPGDVQNPPRLPDSPGGRFRFPPVLQRA